MSGEVGAIDVSNEGIEIWNRSWQTYKDRLFPDDKDAIPFYAVGQRLQYNKRWKQFQYWFTPANTKFDENASNSQLITVAKPIIGIHEVFKPQTTVMDIGCGGGSAAIGMARENPKTDIIATDYELGEKISIPEHHEQNLKFQREDWRHFTLPDGSVDGFVSDQGIARYGNTDQSVKELTRIAKIGAVFRGTQQRGMFGQPNFDDRLAIFGWDVWHLRFPSGGASNIVIAKLKVK